MIASIHLLSIFISFRKETLPVPIEWLQFVELPKEVLPHVNFLLMVTWLSWGKNLQQKDPFGLFLTIVIQQGPKQPKNPVL